MDHLLGFVEIDVSVHVHRDSLAEVLLGSDAVDALLHLAMTTVPTFYRIRGRGQQAVIQKRQGLLQVGGEQLAYGLPEKTSGNRDDGDDIGSVR